MEAESIEVAGNVVETEAVDGEDVLHEINKSENIDEIEEKNEGEHCADSTVENDIVDGDDVDKEKDELTDDDKIKDDLTDGDKVDDELTDKQQSEIIVDEQEREQVDVTESVHENIEDEQKPTATTNEEVVEEEAYVEEPPPDPSAPYDLSDSKEALREPFELRPDQLAEVEQLWDFYQNYTLVYTDIDQYVTKKELVYMLKSLLLMTYTPEQLEELVDYCVRPPHPHGHISYEQFLMMVKIRQRDFPVEEELRSALQVLDPERTGSVERERLKELLATKGHKMPQKQLDNLIKEVDMSNDGTIGIDDVVGTMCVDLNKEDLQMLRDSLNPKKEEYTTEDL